MASRSASAPTVACLLRTRRSALRTICTGPSERSCRRQYTEKRMMPTNTRMLTVSKVLIFLATAMNAAGSWGLPHPRGIPVGPAAAGASVWPAASGTMSQPGLPRAGGCGPAARSAACPRELSLQYRPRRLSTPLRLPGSPRAGAARGRGCRGHPASSAEGRGPVSGAAGRASGPRETTEVRAGRRSAGVRLLPAPPPRRRCGVTRPPSSSACKRGPHPPPQAHPPGTPPPGPPSPPLTSPAGRKVRRALPAPEQGGAGPRAQGTPTKGIRAGAGGGGGVRAQSLSTPLPRLDRPKRDPGERLVKAV